MNVHLIGKNSCGKSSIINAVAGEFIANVSLFNGTCKISKYIVKNNICIFDYPGFADPYDERTLIHTGFDYNFQHADIIVYVTDINTAFRDNAETNLFALIKQKIIDHNSNGNCIELFVLINKYDANFDDYKIICENVRMKTGLDVHKIFRYSSHKELIYNLTFHDTAIYLPNEKVKSEMINAILLKNGYNEYFIKNNMLWILPNNKYNHPITGDIDGFLENLHNKIHIVNNTKIIKEINEKDYYEFYGDFNEFSKCWNKLNFSQLDEIKHIFNRAMLSYKGFYKRRIYHEVIFILALEYSWSDISHQILLDIMSAPNVFSLDSIIVIFMFFYKSETKLDNEEKYSHVIVDYMLSHEKLCKKQTYHIDYFDPIENKTKSFIANPNFKKHSYIIGNILSCVRSKRQHSIIPEPLISLLKYSACDRITLYKLFVLRKINNDNSEYFIDNNISVETINLCNKYFQIFTYNIVFGGSDNYFKYEKSETIDFLNSIYVDVFTYDDIVHKLGYDITNTCDITVDTSDSDDDK